MAKLSQRRYVIVGFLLLVSLTACAQTVRSQQYTSTTLTTLETSNQIATVTVGTQVVSTTVGPVTPVFSGIKTIPGTHGVCGEYIVQKFNGTMGQVLIGSVNASSSVNVYLMSDAVFGAWIHQVVAGGTCTPSTPVLSQVSITSYNFTAPLPSTGVYDLVVNNLSQSTVTTQVNANLAMSTPSAATIVAYSTLTHQVMATVMQTSVQPIQTTGGGISATTIAGAVVVVVIIIIAAYMAMRKRGKP